MGTRLGTKQSGTAEIGIDHHASDSKQAKHSVAITVHWCNTHASMHPPTLLSRMKSAHSICSTSRSTTGRMLPPSPSSGRDARGSLGIGFRQRHRERGRGTLRYEGRGSTDQAINQPIRCTAGCMLPPSPSSGRSARSVWSPTPPPPRLPRCHVLPEGHRINADTGHVATGACARNQDGLWHMNSAC
jgi:hypothetical protein